MNDHDLLSKLIGDDIGDIDITSFVLSKINLSNSRNYLSIAAIIYQQGKCVESKKVLELVLDTIKNDRTSLGLFIRGLFLFIDVSIGCSVHIKNLQNRISQLINYVDGSFRMLDSVYELVSHTTVKQNCVNFRSSDEFMAQLQSANARQFDYYQVISAVLYFQTLLYKCKIYVSCGDCLSARKVVHHALEIFKHYLYRVVQMPSMVLFDRADRKEFSLVDYIGPLEVSPVSAEAAAAEGTNGHRMSDETQRQLVGRISCLFKTAIVLSVSSDLLFCWPH